MIDPSEKGPVSADQALALAQSVDLLPSDAWVPTTSDSQHAEYRRFSADGVLTATALFVDQEKEGATGWYLEYARFCP